MVIRLVDERDVDIRVLECAGGFQPAEAAADDDDAGFVVVRAHAGIMRRRQ